MHMYQEQQYYYVLFIFCNLKAQSNLKDSLSPEKYFPEILR